MDTVQQTKDSQKTIYPSTRSGTRAASGSVQLGRSIRMAPLHRPPRHRAGRVSMIGSHRRRCELFSDLDAHISDDPRAWRPLVSADLFVFASAAFGLAAVSALGAVDPEASFEEAA